MGKKQTPSSKRTRSECSSNTPPSPDREYGDILESIDNKLTSFDARLALVEVLHKEFQALRESLEFSQQQVESLAAEDKFLRDSVKSLNDGVTKLFEENKRMKESILDSQVRSMRDNLVFFGIPERAEEDPETTIKSFLQQQLKLPPDAVENITFHRIHCLGGTRQKGQRPRPVVAKFEHYKQKELVKSRGRELKGTDFSINDQFPKEILERCKSLFPIRRKFIAEGSWAVITVDKFYVNGQLFCDQEITPWLY